MMFYRLFKMVITYFFTIIVTFALFSTFALSQFKINEIIVSGNDEISSETIVAISGLSKSNNLSANSINEGFRRLSDSGLFQNVVLNPVGSRLIISVIENPIINKVDFEGNKIFKDNLDISGNTTISGSTIIGRGGNIVSIKLKEGIYLWPKNGPKHNFLLLVLGMFCLFYSILGHFPIKIGQTMVPNTISFYWF